MDAAIKGRGEEMDNTGDSIKTEQDCAASVKKAKPSATGVTWFQLIDYTKCVAEYGNTTRPSRIARACFFN